MLITSLNSLTERIKCKCDLIGDKNEINLFERYFFLFANKIPKINIYIYWIQQRIKTVEENVSSIENSCPNIKKLKNICKTIDMSILKIDLEVAEEIKINPNDLNKDINLFEEINGNLKLLNDLNDGFLVCYTNLINAFKKNYYYYYLDFIENKRNIEYLEKELPEITKYYLEEKEEMENLLIAYQKTVLNLLSF